MNSKTLFNDCEMAGPCILVKDDTVITRTKWSIVLVTDETESCIDRSPALSDNQ